MFRLKNSSSGVSKNLKINYNMSAHIWDPRCCDSHITWFLPTVVSTCILGWCVCCLLGPLFFGWGPGYVHRGFSSYCFSVSSGWRVAYPLAVCFCFCFASCFSSVSTKLFLLTGSWVTVLRCGKETFQPNRGQMKCDGTRAGTRFRLSAKRTSPLNL